MKLTKSRLASMLVAASVKGDLSVITHERLIVDFVFDAIAKSLQSGQAVVISNFGTFESVKKPPKTRKMFGKSVKVDERVRVRFVPSTALRKSLTKADKEDKNFLSSLKEIL